MPEAFSNTTHNRLGDGPVDPRPGSTLDSVISNLEKSCLAIAHLTARVEQLANTAMGGAERPPVPTKLDHPPCTLQEHVSYLEDNISRLEMQITRFF